MWWLGWMGGGFVSKEALAVGRAVEAASILP